MIVQSTVSLEGEIEGSEVVEENRGLRSWSSLQEQ